MALQISGRLSSHRLAFAALVAAVSGRCTSMLRKGWSMDEAMEAIPLLGDLWQAGKGHVHCFIMFHRLRCFATRPRFRSPLRAGRHRTHGRGFGLGEPGLGGSPRDSAGLRPGLRLVTAILHRERRGSAREHGAAAEAMVSLLRDF